MVKSSNKSVSLGNQPMDKQINSSESKVKFKVNNKFAIKNFETLFGKQIGSNEKAIADYSGAILRDMLISGRLYVTQSHLCFYGSLLKWETKIVIALSDISSIVKAKTIKVIPNAIQIVTRTGDKYVFTSLISRNKVYLTLVSAWTTNLSRNFGSDADKLSKDSSIRKCYSDLESGSRRIIDTHVTKQIKTKRKYFSTGDLADIRFNNDCGDDSLQTNEHMKSIPIDRPIRDPSKCPYTESCLADVILPINLNRLFEMLFTDSSFNSVFTESLKHTVTFNREWSIPTECDLQQSNNSTIAVRQLSREMVLDYPFAKNMSSEEMMYLEHLDASNYYGIKLVSESSGMPLCSMFYVVNYYCLHRTANQSETHLHIHYKIVFKSKAWGFKSFIEDGTKRACVDYVESLVQTIKKWSLDNPEYVKQSDFPNQLKPFCDEMSNNHTLNYSNQTKDNKSPNVKHQVAQLSSESIFAQKSGLEKTETNQSKTNCLSTLSPQKCDEKSSISLDYCKGQCDGHHVHDIVKYLKPFIVFLSLLTFINLFLVIRLMNNQISPSPLCLSNQASPSTLIGLSTSEETFESLSNYAYPSLECHG